MEAREGVTNMGILGAVIIDTVEVDNILKCQQLMSTEDKGLISLEPSMPQRPGSSAKKKKNRTCLVKKEARNKEL
jgi:hypothetical protein